MSGRIRILLTIAAGIAAVAGLVVAARGSTPPNPADPVVVTNTEDPKVVESYWTDERRRSATGG